MKQNSEAVFETAIVGDVMMDDRERRVILM